MKDSWTRAMKGVTWSMSNSTLREVTRRDAGTPESKRDVAGPSASAFKSSALKAKLLLGYLLNFPLRFRNVLVLRCHFLICMFLWFGKAGWLCYKRQYFSSVHALISLFFSILTLPQKITSEICFFNVSLGTSRQMIHCLNYITINRMCHSITIF